MKTAEGDLIPLPSMDGLAADRAVSRRRFERAVRASPGDQFDPDDHPLGRKPHDRAAPLGRVGARWPDAAADAQEALADAVVALKRSLGDGNTEVPPALVGPLLREIMNAARAGCGPLRGDWTLIVRLPESVLARTEIEVSSRHGMVSVLLSTSSVGAYRTIVAALPRLEAALKSMRQRLETVSCRLVGHLEIP